MRPSRRCEMAKDAVKGKALSIRQACRVSRVYRELELNLRIKPKKRLVREKPEPLES